MKNVSHLMAAELLIDVCHQLLTKAIDRAINGNDAVFQYRWESLAEAIQAELTDVRTIVRQTREAA